MNAKILHKWSTLLVGFFMMGYGCSSQSNVPTPKLRTGGENSSNLSEGESSPSEDQGDNSPDPKGKDLDVGGYKQENASVIPPTPVSAPPPPTTPAKAPKPPPKGLQESERHPGQITFQSRLQPFTMTVASFVGGKTVKSQEFKLEKRDKAALSIDGLCVTEGKTCLIVTVSGGVTQTAGKTGCAKAMVKSPTEVLINSDVDGRGIFGTCLEDANDLEDAFTISCPQSQAVVLNECT